MLKKISSNMSLLYRTGNGRNDIAWGGSTSTAGTYLYKTSWTGRESLQWLYINYNTNGTVFLERYDTTRNGIRWNTINFNFMTPTEIKLRDLMNFVSSNGYHFVLYGAGQNSSGNVPSRPVYRCNANDNGSNGFVFSSFGSVSDTITSGSSCHFGISGNNSSTAVDDARNIINYINNNGYIGFEFNAIYRLRVYDGNWVLKDYTDLFRITGVSLNFFDANINYYANVEMMKVSDINAGESYSKGNFTTASIFYYK